MVFHGDLQIYSRGHKENTKPESKRKERQEVIAIMEYCKDYYLYEILVRPNRKENTSQTKWVLKN